MKKTQWPNNIIIFEVPGKVRGKGRPRFTKAGITYTDKKTAEYERLIKMSYLKHTNYISSKSINVSMYVCFAPNKSDTKKTRQLSYQTY